MDGLEGNKFVLKFFFYKLYTHYANLTRGPNQGRIHGRVTLGAKPPTPGPMKLIDFREFSGPNEC